MSVAQPYERTIHGEIDIANPYLHKPFTPRAVRRNNAKFEYDPCTGGFRLFTRTKSSKRVKNWH